MTEGTIKYKVTLHNGKYLLKQKDSNEANPYV
jgi:hypothetical protein